MRTSIAPRSSWRTLGLLLVLNLLWSLHPLYGKVVLSHVAPLQGAWLRYASSWLAWAVVLLLWRKTAGKPSPRSTHGRNFLRLVAMGLSTFFAAPLLQMEGLRHSLATDNAILVSMEPLLAVVLAWVFLDERPGRLQVGGFLASGAGVFMMSNASVGEGGLPAGLLFGNLLIVASMLGEASYSVLGKSLVDQVDPLRGFGVAMGAGALALGLAASLGGHPWIPAGRGIDFWAALFMLGPIGTTGGYLAWWYLLRDIPVRVAALSLFVQPLAGALWGSVILGDPWGRGRAAGAALVLLGALLVIQSELDKSGALTAKR